MQFVLEHVQAVTCLPARNTCFEVFGVDILLDERCRPWLIEVNTCPALGTSSPVDKAVKAPMLADLLHMVGPVPYSKAALDARQAREDHVRPRLYTQSTLKLQA